MEWLTKYHAVIICYEKLVRIPFGNEALTILGDMSEDRRDSRLNIIAHTKTHKYIQKGCHVFLAHITEKKAEEESEEKRLGIRYGHYKFQFMPFGLTNAPTVFMDGMNQCDASHKGLGADAEGEVYGTKYAVFTDHKSLQHILDQKELNMRQHRWLELLNDYDYEIRYHYRRVNKAERNG
ncbi:putative reverse transcriptase domain-containing protein [Tanacetum coccineum]